jgi:hypothetical protein
MRVGRNLVAYNRRLNVLITLRMRVSHPQMWSHPGGSARRKPFIIKLKNGKGKQRFFGETLSIEWPFESVAFAVLST